jgi:ABC-2 type transport system ATP-binding protein
MSIVELKNIFKSYRDKPVFKDFSLTLQGAGVTCLLGPNGAGKTTLFKMLTGQLTPDNGVLKVLGHNPVSPVVRRQVGLTPQESEFPEQLCVREILSFVASHYKTPMSVDHALEKFFLIPFADKKTQSMSGGEKRLLGIACAFIGQAKFVILDEPTVGLDVDRRAQVLKVVREIAHAGTQVIFSTHYLDEAELVSDWIVFINQGQIIRQGRLAQLQKDLGFVKVSYNDKSCVVQNSDEFVAGLFATGEEIKDLRVTECSLDEIFKLIMSKDTDKEVSVQNKLSSQSTVTAASDSGPVH